jgi:hypothetical protein
MVIATNNTMAMRKRTNNDLDNTMAMRKRTNNDLQTIQWP